MPPGPRLAPGSSPYPACLLTSDNGHTKYFYPFHKLGLLSSGSLSSETVLDPQLGEAARTRGRLWLVWLGS